MLVIVGALFTELTVTSKVVVTGVVPSLTVILIVEVPFWLAAGVTVTVRLAPLPPNTMFALGISVVRLELPETVKDPTALSMSPTVKLNAPVAAFSAMV